MASLYCLFFINSDARDASAARSAKLPTEMLVRMMAENRMTDNIGTNPIVVREKDDQAVLCNMFTPREESADFQIENSSAGGVEMDECGGGGMWVNRGAGALKHGRFA